jgi:hypothetical protein
MATLTQTLKRLKAQRSRTQDELRKLDGAIAAVEKLVRTGVSARGQRGQQARRLAAAALQRLSKARKVRWGKGQTGYARDRARLLRRRKV